MSDTLPNPVPYVAPDAEEFWAATTEGKLLLRRCDDCGTVIWYPRPFCPDCGSLEHLLDRVVGQRHRLHLHRGAPQRRPRLPRGPALRGRVRGAGRGPAGHDQHRRLRARRGQGRACRCASSSTTPARANALFRFEPDPRPGDTSRALLPHHAAASRARPAARWAAGAATGALDGIRVLDLSTGVAGPLAAMLLADFGAEVVRRSRTPEGVRPGRPGFAMWNRNKRGLAFDPGPPRAGDRLASACSAVRTCA